MSTRPRGATERAARRALAARSRKAEQRRRQRLGRALVTLELSLAETTDALTEGGWLKEWDAENTEALAAALGAVVEAVTRDEGALLRVLKRRLEHGHDEGIDE
jgi:hypothetical protein